MCKRTLTGAKEKQADSEVLEFFELTEKKIQLATEKVESMEE